MTKQALVVVPIVLFMLALLFLSSILSSALHRPSLKTPSLRAAYRKFTQRSNFTMSSDIMQMPPFMYGTAWKKDRTKELVEMAVRLGFRGIDTACQPKHYHEPGVGDALLALYADNVVTRSDIFLQTKFTSINGQDPQRIPYNANAPLHAQVLESFNKSCANLHTDYLDSLVLHSPMGRFSDTMVVWRAMEEIHDRGGARRLGISNTYDIRVLRQLFAEARVKPTVLQNRFYADSGYDEEIRQFCTENGIAYQSFWTLTANPHILKTTEVRQLARKYGRTAEQVFFAFVRSLGVTPLTGSSSAEHLRQDLDALALRMDPADLQVVHALLH